ncbi:VOC family protein [Owenweeksia hongkongensis]|uniref:VOC family protein n=1 Tax=Owenweeksia hongkongensis TaxID=253245 RepID=UPI003A944A9F
MTKKIYPCLWFDNNAQEAADFYCSIFKESKILSANPVVVNFELNGTKFMALNGGPKYKHTPASSYVIECETQDEIDHYWEKLGEGGRYDQCGWLADQYGVSWQVVPSILSELMSDPDRAPRVAQAFLKMQKFDIETLLKA